MRAAAIAIALIICGASARAWFGKKSSDPVYLDINSPSGDEKRASKPEPPKDPIAEMDEIVAKMKRGDLPRIQFEFDSDKITLESYETLDAIADLLLRNPKLKLMVLAHTCTIGTEQYNLDLSRRRAKSVKTYLVKKGVPPPSIRFRGMGYSQPIADNSTEEGRIKNRRVEFRVTFRDWPAVY